MHATSIPDLSIIGGLMSTPSIPDAIAALLPLLATILSAQLASNHFRPAVNAIISLLAILATAVACELLSADIPASWPLRLAGVLAYVAVLMHGDLHSLYDYLVASPSPVAKTLGVPATNAQITALGTRAYTPSGAATTPPRLPEVPQRTSAQEEPPA